MRSFNTLTFELVDVEAHAIFDGTETKVVM
jgi:hypothetical protein